MTGAPPDPGEVRIAPPGDARSSRGLMKRVALVLLAVAGASGFALFRHWAFLLLGVLSLGALLWTFVGRFMRLRYMHMDPRTAGVFRIALGTLLSADAIRHWSEAAFLYSNVGVLSNDKHLFRPSSGYLFSLFHAFSTLREAHIIFALGLACHLLLLVGYRTKLFALLSFVFVTSMDSRIPLVENGGYIVVNLTTLYASFLPIERRFSIDAWIRSWRARKETTITALNDRTDITGERDLYVSAAVLLALVNFGAIYFWNVVNKAGAVWRRGEAVHYVLHLDRMVTGLAVFARENLPAELIRVADWGTLTVEALLCALILWPNARRYTRPLAMLLVFLLHTTFGLMMRLGPFSWFMILWSTMLPTPYQFDDLERIHRRRTRPIEIAVDPKSPFVLAFARIVARLDGCERVTFVPLPEGAGFSIAVRHDGAWLEAPREIMAEVTRALPFGWFFGTIVGLGPFRLHERLYASLFARRASVERFFGLTREPVPSKAPRPYTSRPVAKVREYFVVYLSIAFISQSWSENKVIPAMLKYTQPKFIEATIVYPRIFQGWGMFAPNPIQEDGILVIDAITIDGRRLDPFTGEAPVLDLSNARGMGMSQLRQDYGNRIRLDRNQIYRDGLRDHLIKLHEVNGRPNDQIVAFDAYWVRDKCPAWGEDKPTANDPVPIYSWRKSGYKQPADQKYRIPTPPKLRSADKWDEAAKETQ